MALGDLLVHELGLENSTNTTGRWMAHYLAELLEQSRTLNGASQRRAEKAAADLILRLWEQREVLPGAVYPLKDLGNVLSILRLLEVEMSPFSHASARHPEKLLAQTFDGLRKLVAHGALLLSSQLEKHEEENSKIPFLVDEEQRVIEALNLWAEHFRLARRPQIFVVDFSSDAPDSTDSAISEALTEEALAKRAFIADIDKLQATLTELKANIGSGQ